MPEKYNIIFKKNLFKITNDIKSNGFEKINLDALYFIIYKIKKCYRIIIYDAIFKNINSKIKNIYECELNNVSNILTIKMVEVLDKINKEKEKEKEKEKCDRKTNNTTLDGLAGYGGRL